jgi:hypothetical protein
MYLPDSSSANGMECKELWVLAEQGVTVLEQRDDDNPNISKMRVGSRDEQAAVLVGCRSGGTMWTIRKERIETASHTRPHADTSGIQNDNRGRPPHQQQKAAQKFTPNAGGYRSPKANIKPGG